MARARRGIIGDAMKKPFARYNPRLKELARRLRRNSTLAEVLLWRELKGKQMMGYDFHRQKPYDEYILDFFCPRLMLAVEIDGDSHMFKEERDAERQRRLEALGVRFLRFDDLDVKFRMYDVLKTIREWIEQHKDDKV
jgi:very-short-patch-repair endonuclease